jgi:integrase/recombinase XerD
MKIKGIYAPHIKQYLEFKRSLGFKLRDAEYVFAQFDRLTTTRAEQSIGITKELSDVWCEKRPNETAGTRYARVSQLSLFARFLCDIGLPSYVPEVPRFQSRDLFSPYIFSRDEIILFLTASDRFLPDKVTHDCSCLMMPTLFRVLYGTGLRIGEALSLEEKDVNLEEKYITVRQSKNGTERIVPMSDSLTDVCWQYRNRKRLRMTGLTKSNLFFVKNDNSPCGKGTAYRSFRQILWKIGISHKGKGLGPRLHDLRHTFACHALAAMSESGLDLYHSLPVLSTYLGHRTLESTDKYVRMTAEMYPDLLKKVNDVCAYVFPELKNDEQL